MDTPKFEQLPHIPGTTTACAWDVWNAVHAKAAAAGGSDTGSSTSTKDVLGTLNHLTPAVVAAAATEIQTGERAALNWQLDACAHVGFARRTLTHTLIDGEALTGGALLANDDEISLNTQISSQWDGLCHFGHQEARVYYNGTTHAELQSLEGRVKAGGPQDWSRAGGICGRGVLVDYQAYAEAHGITYPYHEPHRISVADLEATAAWQKLTFRPGDILVVRTGWLRWHDTLKVSDPQRLQEQTHGATRNVGIEPTAAMAQWLWDHRFAGAAADNTTLEAWPAPGPILHEQLLAGLGCPIGELWDLEALSAMCARSGRYSFFLASAPLNLRGAIASFANAVAIQ